MRLSWPLLRAASHKLLDHYGQYHPSVLSIQQFIDFGRKNASATNSFVFLRKEIPVRLGNIMKEIKLLPEQLLEMPSVQQVEGWYEQSFTDILQFEEADPLDKKVINRFTEALDMIQKRHMTVVETMAEGVNEMKSHLDERSPPLDDRIQYFLDRFYLSRIGIRLLIHQHCMAHYSNHVYVLLFGNLESPSRHIGCFDPICNIQSVAQDAYDNARFLCEQYYSTAPSCIFKCHSPFEKNGNPHEEITMTYVPYHLYYMLFELFKNALRAVVEFHQNSSSLPPVHLLVCKGREDVTIKLADEGGGVPRTEVDKLFKYMYSTAPKPPSPYAITTTPLAGYGYGLPISRLYAKYFNGDLWLNSVHGYGTDAMICLKVVPKDASELLPVYNRTSSQKYQVSQQVGDWSDAVHNSGSGIHRRPR